MCGHSRWWVPLLEVEDSCLLAGLGLEARVPGPLGSVERVGVVGVLSLAGIWTSSLPEGASWFCGTTWQRAVGSRAGRGWVGTLPFISEVAGSSAELGVLLTEALGLAHFTPWPSSGYVMARERPPPMPISWPGWSHLRRGLARPGLTSDRAEPVTSPHPWPCPILEQVGAVWAGRGWEPEGSKALDQSQACLIGRLERLQPLCLVLCSGLGGGGMGWGGPC